MLEAYLADLHASWPAAQRHGDHIGQLNAFLHAVRQHRWDDTLPATALVLRRRPPEARRTAARERWPST